MSDLVKIHLPERVKKESHRLIVRHLAQAMVNHSLDATACLYEFSPYSKYSATDELPERYEVLGLSWLGLERQATREDLNRNVRPIISPIRCIKESLDSPAPALFAYDIDSLTPVICDQVPIFGLWRSNTGEPVSQAVRALITFSDQVN